MMFIHTGKPPSYQGYFLKNSREFCTSYPCVGGHGSRHQHIVASEVNELEAVGIHALRIVAHCVPWSWIWAEWFELNHSEGLMGCFGQVYIVWITFELHVYFGICFGDWLFWLIWRTGYSTVKKHDGDYTRHHSDDQVDGYSASESGSICCEQWHVQVFIYIYIPGTQLTLVLIGKDLVLEAKQRTFGFQVYTFRMLQHNV